MQVDGAKEGANPVKVKADDDPEAEGEWMRLSFIRFKLTRSSSCSLIPRFEMRYGQSEMSAKCEGCSVG